MQKNRYFPMTLIAVAIMSGCSSIPQNTSLAEAHGSYNSARSNPQITELAAVELKDAGDSLNKADQALSKGESEASVNQLAYIARQQVGIAQETAKRKSAESAVANAGAKRDQERLAARTSEADVAHRQVARLQQANAQQANALDAANDNAEREQAHLKAVTAEANAQAERDRALIAQQEMQLKELNAQKTKRGLVITLGDVLFHTNKAQLQSGGMHNVQKLADFLRQYPRQKVLIEGYTDSTGSNSHNQALSELRANAVRTALIDQGTPSDRIAMRGYGEKYPVAGNDTAANRQLNRRVEIILSDDDGNIVPR